MSSKVFPYSPRSKAYGDQDSEIKESVSNQKSPRTKPPLSRGNSGQLEDFFEVNKSTSRVSRNSFLDSAENSLSNVEKSPNIARKHKNSIDFTNQKKEKKANSKFPQSPRSREESSGSRPNSSTTPRSKGGEDAQSSQPPPLQRSSSRKGSTKKLLKKKGVTFRVPLEDRYGYDNTVDSTMVSPEHSLSEEDFKKLPGSSKAGKDEAGGSAKVAGKSKAEIRRMIRKRNRKHKKGCVPAIARKCAVCTSSCVIS